MQSGAGTNVCARCGGAKEPTRRNSNRCRTCDKPAAKGASPSTTGDRLTAMGHTLRIGRVPGEVLDALEAEALRKSTTVAALVRDLLITRHDRIVSRNQKG